jgi:large subunit ribosomal protein L1
MGSKKNADMTQTEDVVKVVADPDAVVEGAESTDSEQSAETTAPAKKAAKQGRGKKYRAVRAHLDKSKLYPIVEAVEVVKKASYSNFVGSVEAHLLVREVGMTAELSLPHSTGKSVKVAIVDEALLEKIAAGNIDFDVLVAHPEFMPKLARFAKVLGPKGLMPNPKNGTLTPNPEIKKKALEAGAFVLKTEKKAPLMHLSIGKVDMPSNELAANIEALLKALKGKVLKLSIAPSMGLGVKVLIEDKEEV